MAAANTEFLVDRPGRGPRRKRTPRTRVGPSKAVRQSIEVNSFTTKNDYNHSPRKRNAESQQPPSKRRKRNLDKSYNPKHDRDDEDENCMFQGEQTKRYSTTTPPSSRKRRGSVYKDPGEYSSDNESDGKKKGRKRFKGSSPTPLSKRQKKDHDGGDDDGAGSPTNPPAKNTRASWKIRRALVSTTTSHENSEKSKPQTTTTPKGKGKAKKTIQGILPIPIF